MKQVLIKGGGVVVQDVPAPTVGEQNVLVQVRHSCVSVGTEIASVAQSGLPLYRRAWQQPRQAKRALQLMAEGGVRRTVGLVRERLDAALPAGYSAAGEVIGRGAQAEGFRIGDLVACAGAGVANHAEIIDVPVNLVARVPAGLGTEAAATVSLGAIALQGVRRVAASLGETIVVLGLGIIGQITAQILRASGCVVIATDVDPRRVRIARDNGADHGLAPADGPVVERVAQLTNGGGADGVIVTAAAPGHEVISQAFRSCRRKARVVLVGDVGLHLDRNDLYAKELDFLISTSYGPGRYDPDYEQAGHDYPLPYVRWTENRNMQEYLRLLATGAVRLERIPTEVYEVDRAPAAYDTLQSAQESPLLVVLRYPHRVDARAASVGVTTAPVVAGRIQVAVVGAGAFARAVHLPNLARQRARYQLRTVVSRTGTGAVEAAQRAGAARASTDLDDVLGDPAIDLVMILTRHHQHAAMALRALRAGKHVFVEKPLALDETELAEIEAFFRERRDPPLLMTGFNRRFAPAVGAIRRLLETRTSPMVVNYVMNAGFIANDHWVHGPQGGGRNVGEACHAYDLFNALVGHAWETVSATSLVPRSAHWRRTDNFVATVRYDDGSLCSLTYTALGDPSYPKERCEIFADGRVIVLDDFKSVRLSSRRRPLWSARMPAKGHAEELLALATALQRPGPWPISLADQLAATRLAFAVERQLLA